MLGGSISRYHTPQLVPQVGAGIVEDLIKIAGPTVVGALERGVEGVQQGRRAGRVFGREAKRVVGQLKRKALLWWLDCWAIKGGVSPTFLLNHVG